MADVLLWAFIRLQTHIFASGTYDRWGWLAAAWLPILLQLPMPMQARWEQAAFFRR